MTNAIDLQRRRLLASAASLALLAPLGTISRAKAATLSSSDAALSSLATATAWLNSPPLAAAGLSGQVVLVNFWTYTCINWLRSLPYVRAWANRYKHHGLVVIGVHAPEFAFEKDLDNVRRAAKDLDVGYPIAVDNEHAIWQAFQNHAWPALYLLDGQGRVRHRHFGEGEYEQSERMIQRLLAENGAAGIPQEPVSVDARGVEAAADWGNLRSPENYLGYERTERFASPGGARPGSARTYTLPPRLTLNQWALAGDWTVASHAAVLNNANGRIACRFHARDLHLVMRPSSRTRPVRFRVRIDGQALGAAHGIDVDEHGTGTVSQPRMYQLVRQPKPIVERQFEIEFLDAGVEAFAFTFG